MEQQNQYFVFTLDGQHYAMEISLVEKIIHAVELIHLPETAKFLLGIINMDGKVIPVANIRKRFNWRLKKFLNPYSSIFSRQSEEEKRDHVITTQDRTK